MYGTNYPAGSVEKHGVTVEIFVDNDGTWKAEFGGRELHADTRDKLAGKIAVQAKKVTANVRVPFTRVTDGSGSWGSNRITAVDGVATGFHSANGNVLVTWASGVKEQFKDHGSTSVPLDADEKAEYVRLATAAREARNALREFDNIHRMDLRKAIEDAQNTAAP